jgi:pimeloyl-ACP methyl ester carboxylesterase
MIEAGRQTVHRIRTPDGRTIRAFDGGDPEGAPFIYHHGTPLCGRLPAHVVDDAAAHGLRVITYDRPGYGESSRLPGLRVGSSALDMQAVADHFQLGRFATAGVSGGGPHVLAGAALLPARVVAAAVVAGDAPFDAEGLDWFAGMGDLNTEERDVMEQGEEVYHAYLREQAAELAGSTPDELRQAMASLLSPVDSAALTGEVITHMHAAMTEALANGIEGWADESAAVYEPWGFDVSSIDVPVRIWHGEHDRFVPVAHGRWLAQRIPGARFDLRPDDGHVSLIESSPSEIHAWLAERLAAV